MFWIYIIIFWLSIIGYSLYFKYKFDIKNEFLLSIVFSLVSIIMFISGLINILKLASIILLVTGIVLGIIVFLKNKKDITTKIKKPNWNIILVFILLLYVTLVYKDMHFLHYDNFSHWGTIVKHLLINNSFPNFESTIIEFKAYQPGTACFIYYFCNLLKIKEGYMILAQNYLFIGFISALFGLVKGKYKNIFRVVIFTSIIFISIANILPYDLLVDTILTAVLISSFVIMFEYKNDIKKLFYLMLPLTIFLTLIKNSGILLVFIICCLFLYYSILNKNYKKGIIYAILLGLTSLFILHMWSSHVEFAYGSSALESHHAMTLNNILPHIKSLGMEKIIYFIKIYIKNFINLNNIPNIVIIILNLLLLSFIPILKSKKKLIFESIIIMDLIYLFYYFMLGVMYIFSMEESSLFKLPCFNRYMYTIVFSLFGLFLIYFVNLFKNYSKKIFVYLYSTIVIICIIIFILLGYCDNFNLKKHYKIFIGQNDYNFSYSKKIDEILKNNYINTNDNLIYYVYLKNQDINKDAYIWYMSKYKLNDENINIIYDLNDLDLDENEIIVALDEIEIDDNKHICEISEGIYKSCNNE